MRITRELTPTFTMTFSLNDGWSLVMALSDAFYKYPEAQDRDKWLQWSKDLDAELRR